MIPHRRSLHWALRVGCTPLAVGACAQTVVPSAPPVDAPTIVPATLVPMTAPASVSRARLDVEGFHGWPPGLSQSALLSFIRDREGELRAGCWNGRYAATKSATFEYAVAIDPGGRPLPAMGTHGILPATATLLERGAPAASPELARCLRSAIDDWRFPTAPTPTRVLITLELSTRRASPGPVSQRAPEASASASTLRP